MYMQQSAAPWGHINIYVQYRVATYSIALSLLVCARCFYSCCSYCSYYLLVLYIYAYICVYNIGCAFYSLLILYIYIYIYVYIYYMHTCTHACIHTYTYVYTYIHTYIHIICIYRVGARRCTLRRVKGILPSRTSSLQRAVTSTLRKRFSFL
jgi:hypothetical protein